VAAGSLVGILAAAGTGERLGGGEPKAFVPCAGRRLLEWSLEPLDAVCDRVIVAVPPGTQDSFPGVGRVELVAGGPSRSQSVLAAVKAAPEAGFYLVHDAARPLVTKGLAARCAREVVERGWDGAVAAAPLADTVKEGGPDRGVLRTLDRSRLWAAQTPQAFRGDVLRRALDADVEQLAAATDDASLVEAAGGRVVLVEAPAENIKVTGAADLATAEALLRARGAPADR
jgi:2-C-methyl-D-erythritol 4-phosphate cytidylyltransferase